MNNKLTYDELNEQLRRTVDETDWGAMDKQINKDTASANMSAAHMGLLHSQATKDAISAALKGRPVAIVTCPHCGKTGGNAAMHRWHFDACPDNPRNKRED